MWAVAIVEGSMVDASGPERQHAGAWARGDAGRQVGPTEIYVNPNNIQIAFKLDLIQTGLSEAQKL
jgi:hypothetical protein